MRSSADVYIYIDMESALRGSCDEFNSTVVITVGLFVDGLQFYVSANNVILSPGNAEGCIPTRYFRLVENRRGEQLQLPIDALRTTTTD